MEVSPNAEMQADFSGLAILSYCSFGHIGPAFALPQDLLLTTD
jgi:hypothetical protein